LALIDPKKYESWDKWVDITLSLINPVYAFNRLFTQISVVQNSNQYTFSHNAFDYDQVTKYHW